MEFRPGWRFLPTTMTESPNLGLFIGRFHIILLHLPIGMLLMLAGLELVSRLPGCRNANASAGYILAIAAPASALAAGCGWLLAGGGGYDETLLFRHRWLGVATAGLCLLTACLWRAGRTASYRLALFATVPVLTAASHFGGSLTHGQDFLTRYAPAPLRELGGGRSTRARLEAGADAREPAFAAAVILPLFARTCVPCHGPDKAKGKLRLDTIEAVLRGGEWGPAIQPGRPADSLLLHRTALPLDHDDHMPPAGKTQPTADELALLRWWVEVGAPADRKLSELNPSADIRAAAAAVTKP